MAQSAVLQRSAHIIECRLARCIVNAPKHVRVVQLLARDVVYRRSDVQAGSLAR